MLKDHDTPVLKRWTSGFAGLFDGVDVFSMGHMMGMAAAGILRIIILPWGWFSSF